MNVLDSVFNTGDDGVVFSSGNTNELRIPFRPQPPPTTHSAFLSNLTITSHSSAIKFEAIFQQNHGFTGRSLKATTNVSKARASPSPPFAQVGAAYRYAADEEMRGCDKATPRYLTLFDETPFKYINYFWVLFSMIDHASILFHS